MKKITFVMILLVCTIISTQAQTTLSVKTVFTKHWDSWKKEWTLNDDGTSYPSTMKILVFENLVVVTDKAHSNYRLGKIYEEKNDSTVIFTTWYATDEKNIKCKVHMSGYKDTGNMYIKILYDNALLEYLYEKED